MRTNCIKSIKSKKGGQEFIKGNSYDYVIDNGAVRIYSSNLLFVTIKNPVTFNKYFRF